MMGSVRSDGCDVYYEEAGEGVPILLIPAVVVGTSAGATSNFVQLIADTITAE
jgi:hypothetical protein